MNKQKRPLSRSVASLENRAFQSCILAGLLWLGELGFGFKWFIFPIAVLLLYAAICVVYACVLWVIEHKNPE